MSMPLTTLSTLQDLQIGEMAMLPPEVLARMKAEIQAELHRVTLLKEWIEMAIMLRYEDKTLHLRRQMGKMTGIIHFEDEGYVVSVDVPKKIDWDQALLRRAFKQLQEKGEAPESYAEVSYKISERQYAACPNSIRALFEPARMVKIGKVTYSLKAKEGRS